MAVNLSITGGTLKITGLGNVASYSFATGDEFFQSGVDLKFYIRYRGDVKPTKYELGLYSNISLEGVAATSDTDVSNYLMNFFDKPTGDSGLEVRVEDLENQLLKVAYYGEITTTSGQISVPTGGTILLDQWSNGIDCLISKIVSNKPDYEDTNILCSFDTSGNYSFTESLPSNPSALIYYLLIKRVDLGNLDTELIIEQVEVNNNNLSVGITEMPTLTDNADGSINVSGGKVNLFNNSNSTGNIYSYDLEALPTTTLTDLVVNYVIADYNNGTPAYKVTTDVSVINESNVAPIYTIYRMGNVLNFINWDTLGNGLSNKLHARFVKTLRFGYESGFSLSEKNTRELLLSTGVAWHGAVRKELLSVDSILDTMIWWFPIAGVWNNLQLSAYPNTQYSDGTDIQTLLPNKYTTISVFRTEADSKKLGLVLGGSFGSYAEASSSELPAVPQQISSLGFLVARIIVKQGQDLNVIQSAFTKEFQGANVYSHNQLADLLNDDHLQYLLLAGRGGQEIRDSLKIGDIDNGNFFEIESDGTTAKRGDATVWNDIVGSLIARSLSSTSGKLDYNWDNNSITAGAGGSPTNSADRLMFNFQYPHSGVETNVSEGTQAAHHLHVHWEQTSSAQVEWRIDYRIQHNGQAKITTWTTVTANSTDDSVFTYISGTLNQITNLVVVNIPEPSLSATVQYRVTRTDSNTGNIEIIFVDAHVESDTEGSREEFIK